MDQTLDLPAPSAGGSGALAPAELAELLGAFNTVTARLQTSHDALRSEVARLTRELGEANSQLERSRRLAALGEMAAGIAHEVRNPLGSIGLYARMLEQDLSDRPSEAGVACKIAGAARALDAVVGDVLTFAREFRIRPTPIDPVELFDRVLEGCCHDGVSGWRSVEVVRRDREPAAHTPQITADAGLLQQALTNVVRNAYEAMAESPGGLRRLTLGIGSCVLPDATGESRAFGVLSVRDSGPGVHPDVIARMFNPFFTTRGTGTGLGLAIVHRIVDAHGGRVGVHNNSERGEGPGATVEVLLPLVGCESDRGGNRVRECAAGLGPRQRAEATR